MTAPLLQFRLAVPGDAAAIAAKSRTLVEHGLRWVWQPDKIRSHIERRDTTVLKVVDGCRMAGFAMMVYGSDTAHLCLLAVDPDYRRRGGGSGMVKWLEKSARVAGVFSVNLEVRQDNTGARQFYQSLGYREIGRRRGYYQAVEDAIRMHHDLSVAVFHR